MSMRCLGGILSASHIVIYGRCKVSILTRVRLFVKMTDVFFFFYWFPKNTYDPLKRNFENPWQFHLDSLSWRFTPKFAYIYCDFLHRLKKGMKPYIPSFFYASLSVRKQELAYRVQTLSRKILKKAWTQISLHYLRWGSKVFTSKMTKMPYICLHFIRWSLGSFDAKYCY